MFRNTVTLFNYDEEKDEYIKTLFENVELQSKTRIDFNVDRTEDEDTSLLIIKYYITGIDKKVIGINKSYKTPKEWSKLAEKKNNFTFEAGRDFYAKGDYTLLNITSYEQFKHTHDDVFMINEIRDYEDDLKHWEIIGY